ncbi:hypothetical protein AVEN_274529-1 [Araneus ventricosus]|uniref:Uncharacterized protein n=1 Tax=Araneus ventricosus TaxID=182803 RepID=A0A4Y2N3E4_ARAVE|nr:hypothetical protein AVEN_274529-1 [Araneus ventricosus]
MVIQNDSSPYKEFTSIEMKDFPYVRVVPNNMLSPEEDSPRITLRNESRLISEENMPQSYFVEKCCSFIHNKRLSFWGTDTTVLRM